ncbi:MAG: peptidoglycan-binding protein [Lachnospiraceae bacterium]|nr:peptidoglycan-binding protein [Lachnospiraceae bacterium]
MKKKLFVILFSAIVAMASVTSTAVFAGTEMPEYKPGYSRTSDYSTGDFGMFSGISQKTMTADELCGLYGIELSNGFPLFQPEHGQPMNMYIVIHPDCQVPVLQNGTASLYKVSELGDLMDNPLPSGANGMFHGNKYFDLKDKVYTIMELIRDHSDGCIQFVHDPDDADLLLSVNTAYSYYAEYYTESGDTTTGYSCLLTLDAIHLSNPSNRTETSFTRHPEDQVTNPTIPEFYVSFPDNADLDLGEFTEAILGWYGNDAAEGSSGNGIAQLQQTLIDRGFLEGTADGNFGPATRDAVLALQQYCGLEPTGTVDHDTLLHIYYSSTTPFGSIDTPVFPEVTALPDITAIPDISALPDVTAIPDITALPDVSALPDISEIPTPAMPSTPIPSSLPDLSDIAGIPDISGIPDIPGIQVP